MPAPERREFVQRGALWVLAAAMGMPASVRAQVSTGAAELIALSALASDEGVLLNYRLRLNLPKEIEQMLWRGVAIVFVAEAVLLRHRWYWVDQDVSHTSRRWRLAWQPLMRRWRLSTDGLSRHFSQLAEALDAISSAAHWHIGEPIASDDIGSYAVEFGFKLDVDELPRPLQYGLADQPQGELAVQRRVRVSPSVR